MLELTKENPRRPLAPSESRPIQLLKGEHEVEVLDFLSAYPLLTFIMTGWIKDNGLVSPLNRGNFYASRNDRGELAGVALIGHITMFEANSSDVIAAFAGLTQNCRSAFAVLGEKQRVNQFMSYYPQEAPQPRLVCRELLFEQRSRQPLEGLVPCLRRATTEELDLVVPIHAQMFLEATGANPLERDPSGFRQRCARRIQQGRVWVCIENGRLLFKADVISDLAEVNYLEGVYVNPESRGKGFGTSCVRQLSNVLLTHTRSVCLLSKEERPAAHGCFLKAGYKLREYYETVFLQQNSDETEN